MKREHWKVVKNGLITPSDLRNRPDDFGGIGMHMVAAVEDSVYTVGIHEGCSHVSVQTDKESAARIIKDGGVDLYSEGYWSRINSPKVKVCFMNSDEQVKLWGGGIFQ